MRNYKSYIRNTCVPLTRIIASAKTLFEPVKHITRHNGPIYGTHVDEINQVNDLFVPRKLYYSQTKKPFTNTYTNEVPLNVVNVNYLKP